MFQTPAVDPPPRCSQSVAGPLAIGNVSKQREATTGGDGNDGRATGGCCDANPNHKPRSHDTSRIA